MRIGDLITGFSASLICGLLVIGVIAIFIGGIGIIFFDEDWNKYKMIQLIYIILFVYIGISLNHTLMKIDGKIFPKEVKYINNVEKVENTIDDYIVDGELLENIDAFKFPKSYGDLGNFIVRGEKYDDTVIYGQTHSKISGYEALILSDDLISTFNNDTLPEVSVECAQKIKELYEMTSHTNSVDKSSEHSYVNTLLESNYDNKIKELENKLYNVESKMNDLENKINQSKGIEKAGLFDVIKLIVIIWLIGIVSYIVITRNNLKIKRDLINTSSEVKIREGVMLDKNQ